MHQKYDNGLNASLNFNILSYQICTVMANYCGLYMAGRHNSEVKPAQLDDDTEGFS